MKKPKIKQEIWYAPVGKCGLFHMWWSHLSRKESWRRIMESTGHSKSVLREAGWRIVKVRISEVK